MKAILLALLFVLALPVASWAVCPTPLTVKDAAGATQNISTTDDAGGNCQTNVIATPPVNITATDCSGTIATGGTAQNAFTAQTTLHGFTVANIDSTAGSGEPLWVSFTTTAAASTVASYPLPPPTTTSFSGYGSFTTPPGFALNHAMSIIGATTAHKYSCTWW